jgi:hemoglobin-like flavoprotein
MTPQQIALVQASFTKVVPVAAVAADLFYQRLFELAPDVRPMFAADLSAQKRKLIDTLAYAVASLSSPDKLGPELVALGERHADYGTKVEHFTPVGEALLWALQQALNEEFTHGVADAWEAVYSELAQVMIDAMMRKVSMAAKQTQPFAAAGKSAGNAQALGVRP